MTQVNLILDYMRKGNSITSIQALEMFGCFRLASRISEIKKQGVGIKTSMIHNGDKHYASYRIMDNNDLFT